MEEWPNLVTNRFVCDNQKSDRNLPKFFVSHLVSKFIFAEKIFSVGIIGQNTASSYCEFE